MPAPVKLPLPKKSPPKGGRPCLLTPNRKALLSKAIEDGLPLKQAAMLARISYDTFNRWRKRGEAEDAPLQFRKSCEALDGSEAVAMQRLLNGVSEAGKNDWRAVAWNLERRFREEFGKSQQMEFSGPGGKPIQAVAGTIPEGDCEVLRRMTKQKGLQELVAKLGALLSKQKAEKEERPWQEDAARRPTRLRE